jgi:hypothetical protein
MTEPTIDVASAVNALLTLADRTPRTPHGHIIVHPDEIMEIITRFLTAPTVIGCGCLGVADERLVIHRITNICPTHGADRPVDFYGDGFWAGYHGGDDNDRADWDAGYAAGANAVGDTLAVRPL